MKELTSTATPLPETWVHHTLFYRVDPTGGWLTMGPYAKEEDAILAAMTLTAENKILVSTELPL